MGRPSRTAGRAARRALRALAIAATLASTRARAETIPAPLDAGPRQGTSAEETADGGGRLPVELLPRLPMAGTAGWQLAPEPAPSTPEARAEDRLDAFLDETLREDAVSSGQVDGWYYGMARAMRGALRPRMAQARRERRASMGTLERLVDRFRRYAAGPERPQDLPGTPPRELSDNYLDELDRAGLELADQLSLLNAPVDWHEVDVRVTQNPEGEVAGAWVLRSSGSPVLDEDVLRAVHEGTFDLPPPPERLVVGRETVLSDWRFEIGDVARYAGQTGCLLDAGAAAGGCGLSPDPEDDDLVRTRVRLLRVLDADHPARARPPRDQPRQDALPTPRRPTIDFRHAPRT